MSVGWVAGCRSDAAAAMRRQRLRQTRTPASRASPVARSAHATY